MRLASLAIASLVLASTATAGSTAVAGSTAASAKSAKATCAASLQKVTSSNGYKIVRKCGSDLAIGQQPIVDGLGQSEGADAGGVILSLFAVGAIGAGIYVVSSDGDTVLPDDDDGGLNPVSP